MRPKVLHDKRHRTPKDHDCEKSEQDAVMVSVVYVAKPQLCHSQHSARARDGLTRGHPSGQCSACFGNCSSLFGVVEVRHWGRLSSHLVVHYEPSGTPLTGTSLI